MGSSEFVGSAGDSEDSEGSRGDGESMAGTDDFTRLRIDSSDRNPEPKTSTISSVLEGPYVTTSSASLHRAYYTVGEDFSAGCIASGEWTGTLSSHFVNLEAESNDASFRSSARHFLWR